MLIATIVFYFFVFISCKKKVAIFSNKLYDEGWSLENTNAIRGILSIAILLHHLTNGAVVDVPYISLTYAGTYGVGVFFFLSGYAMQLKTKETKGEYLQNYFSKRFSKILYPYIAFVLIYGIVAVFVNEESVIDIANQFRWGSPVSNSWYVLAIMVLYVFFYCSNKIKSGAISDILICIFTLIYIVTLILCRNLLNQYFSIPFWYYRNLILFPLGCVVGKHKEIIEEILKRYYWMIFACSTFLLVVGYLFLPFYNRIEFLQCKGVNQWELQEFMIGLFGTIDIMLILKKVSISNKVTQWLGKYSFEIYLIHGTVIMYLSKLISHTTFFVDEGFTFLVITVSILMSVPLKMLFDFITQITSRKATK